MEQFELQPQQQPWVERKKRISEQFSFLRKEDLLLIEYNPSEFIERLQFTTGLSRAEIISRINDL